jgi:hypothetical protein
MRSQECRQGLGVMVELTKALGKITNGNSQRVHLVQENKEVQ